VTRLTISSAVCAAALALLCGCSSDQPPRAGTAAPASAAAPSSAPAGGPATSAPAPSQDSGAALCDQVVAAKTALNEELKGVVSPDGSVPPAAGKKVMTGLATKLTGLAASADGELATALKGLAAEATKAAATADPVKAALTPTFDAAGQRVDKACTKG
jgi:hypothetical protein